MELAKIKDLIARKKNIMGCPDTTYSDNFDQHADSSSAHARIKRYMRKHNIDPMDERSDLSSKLIRPELVKISGSVHIANGRIAPRWATNLRFFFSSFR